MSLLLNASTDATTSASAASSSTGGGAPAGLNSTAVNTDDYHSLYYVAYYNIEMSVALSLLELIGASVIAAFFTQRVRLEDFKSLHGLRRISLPRLYLALLFLTSWLFFAFSAVLMQGVGINLGRGACQTAILMTTVLYSGSKTFVYLFLGERVHIVWYATLARPRYKCPLYVLALLLVLAYFGVVCYLIVVHMARFDTDDLCHLGLKLEGAILLVIFDVIISVTMTSLFIFPLLRNTFHHSYLRDIAKRSVCAASIALIISVINISSLAAIGGTGLGGIVLACWQGDALVSAIVFFWLTSGSGLRPSASAATMPPSSARRRSWASSWLRRTSTTLTTLLDFSFRGDGKRQSALPTSMLDLQDPVSPTSPVYVPKEVAIADEKKDEKRTPQTTFMTVGPRALPADVVLARRPILQRAPPSDLSITVVATDSESAEVAGSELCMLEEEGVRALSMQGCCCQRELARRESRS